VFLVPHKFEDKHFTFVIKVSLDIFVHRTYANFVPIFCAPKGTLLKCRTTAANGSNLIVNSCREFDNNGTTRTTAAPGLS